jgi:uncharacterized membrane protein YciS (DUF1049 family)
VFAVVCAGVAALVSPQGAPGIAAACGALLTGLWTGFLWLVTAGTFRLSGLAGWFYALGVVYSCLFCAGFKTLIHLRKNEVKSKRRDVPYPAILKTAIAVGITAAVVGGMLLLFHMGFGMIEEDPVTAHRYLFDPSESFYGRLEQILLALSHIIWIVGVFGSAAALDFSTDS